MNFIKRIFIFCIAVIITVIPLIPQSRAIFTGDERIVVLLDPGHGGTDPGAAGIRNEAYYNLEVALAAKAKLEENGNFIVHMSRSTADKTLTIAERLYYADTVNADVVISIHFNSSATSNIGGVEVYGSVLDRFYLGTLGQKISSKVAAAAGITNRGVFRKYDYGSTLYYWSEEYQWDIPDDSSVGGLSDYYGVITWGAKFGIPSLIIEHAYLSNSNERNLVDDPAILKAMGEADAEALIEYYTNHTHSYGEEIIDAPVTCFSAGKKSVHCTVCDHRINITSVTDAPDDSRHIWLKDGEDTSATCESDGYSKYYCRYTHNLNDKGCEQFKVHRKEDVEPALGHNYEITSHREVTHTVDGITTYTCTRCSNSYSETVPAEGHSFELTDHADPDCITDGYDTYSCPECGESYSDPIPMLGHDFAVTERVEPACEAEGFEIKKCNTCGFEEKEVFPATGHDIILYSDVLPNCTEEGLRITKCSRCDLTEEIVVEKTGHNFFAAAEISPTCEVGGELLNQCIVCSFEETVILDATGHDYETVDELAPTCTAEGSITQRCRTCGKEVIEAVPAIGHSFDGDTVIKEPGLFFDGEKELICANDPAHVMRLAVRDLTVYEYKDMYPAKFALLCGTCIIVIIGIVVLVMIVKPKRHRPNHAKPKQKKKDTESVQTLDKSEVFDLELGTPEGSEKEKETVE